MNDETPPPVPRRRAPPPPSAASEVQNSNQVPNGALATDSTTSADPSAREIPKYLGIQLVELVRVGTRAPHAACVEVAMHFLGMLRDELHNDEVARALRLVEQQIGKSDSATQVWSAEDVHGLVGRSDDAMRFRHIARNLVRLSNSDRQHRSTYFDDDYADLHSTLGELRTLCADADPRIVQYCVVERQYEALHTLVTLFCMNTRVEVRASLADILLSVLHTERKVARVLLESPFAYELARQFTQLAFNQPDADADASGAFTLQLGRVLTALFATGEQLPTTLSDLLNLQFVTNCLKRLEAVTSDSAAVVGEQHPHEIELADLLFDLLVSFNLHFADTNSNLMLAAMRASAADTRAFSEKLLQQFNALEEPLDRYRAAASFRPFHVGREQKVMTLPNAVAKALADCFDDPNCAELFYTNDIKVLVDILLRFVVDLNAGDARRSDVLRLALIMVSSATFAEHRHRDIELRDAVANVADDSASPLVFSQATSLSQADADQLCERANQDRQLARRIVTQIDRLGTSL